MRIVRVRVWTAQEDMGYTSTSVPLEDEAEDGAELVAEEGAEGDAAVAATGQLHYEVGDASKPDLSRTSAPETKCDGYLVLNAVDDSGTWGRGGFFRYVILPSSFPSHNASAKSGSAPLPLTGL